MNDSFMVFTAMFALLAVVAASSFTQSDGVSEGENYLKVEDHFVVLKEMDHDADAFTQVSFFVFVFE